MERIGIRELKARASEVLRSVREERATYQVTYRGEAIANIVPVEDAAPESETPEQWLAALDEIIDAISDAWPEGVSAQEAIDDVRRTL